MEEKELNSIYCELQKFLCDCSAKGNYHELLDELYLVAKTKNTSSSSDYEEEDEEDEEDESIWDDDSWVHDPELGCQG